MSTEVVKSLSIDNLVNQRESVRLSLERAKDALDQADLIVHAISDAYAGNRLGHRGVAALLMKRDAHLFEFNVESAMKSFDAQAWHHLLHASGMRSLMDAKAREAWDKQIQDCDVPELTKATIESTFAAMHNQRGEMFERGVIACFKGLAWDYKTNLPVRFGKRIVLTYMVGYHSTKTDHLDDLMRVMCILDGKPEPDHRNGISALLSNAGLSRYSSPTAGKCENDYVKIKTFKNGNGHIEFKRPDLVERMNKIIAAHFPGALPRPAGTPVHGMPGTGDLRPEDFDDCPLDHFPTPADLAAQMADRAGICPGMAVLEPSAGDGNLAFAAMDRGAKVHCFELDQARALALREKGLGLTACSDFLRESPDDTPTGYQAILMNPPFSKRRDTMHVLHAYKFLRPGGTLVAVMSGGAKFRDDNLGRQLHALVDGCNGRFESLPDGTFKEAGTDVRTVLLTMRKPIGSEWAHAA